MPFISNQERQSLVKKTNSKSIFRKTFLIVSIIALILVIVLILSVGLSWILQSNALHSQGLTEQEVWVEMCKNWWSPFTIENLSDIETGKPLKITLSGFMIFSIIFTVLAIGSAIVSIILVFTFESPNSVKQNIKILEAAPLSGKSNENLSPVEIIEQRREPIENAESK